MKNLLEMVLFSRRSLTATVAAQQISALSNFADGIFCPDKCGEFEPLRTPFDPADITVPVQQLAKPQGDFFYRKGKPIYLGGEIWNRTLPETSRFPSPLFSNYWTGRFDGSWAKRIGIEKIEGFVSTMLQITESDFALLTTENDKEAKNMRKPVLSYQGFDLDLGIPGLYWINIFSEGFAKWVGVNGFPKELAASKELADGSILLKFCEAPEQCRDLETLMKQRATIEWLGREKFFDINFPDRKLDTPDWSQIPLRRPRTNEID